MSSHIITKTLTSENETYELAKRLGARTRCYDLIRLNGELGAGKSVFARGIIHGLGNTEPVPSPTYTLLQTYENGRLPVAHLDAYRLGDPSELAVLDLADWREHGVIVAEWPDNGGDELRADQPELIDYYHCSQDNAGVLDIQINIINETEREIVFSGGPSWQRRLALVCPELMRESSDEKRAEFLASRGLPTTHENATGSKVEAWSTRSYWRIQTKQGSKILMDAPPPIQESQPVVDIANYLHENGFIVPQIELENSDVAAGYIVQSDLGNRILQREDASKPEIMAWYDLATDLAVKLAQLPVENWRSYVPMDMWLEVIRLTDYYLPFATGKATPITIRQEFEQIWQPLFAQALDVPQGFMHSDYHAGNLMMLTEQAEDFNSIGLIDFQDASAGPITYDIAGFLWSDRVPLSVARQQELLTRFLDGLDGQLTEEQFRNSGEILVIQRMIKIIGILGRLISQTGNKAFYPTLQRCFGFVDELLAKRVDRDTADLKQWWERHVPRPKG